jgi:glycerophosphoryl diester phosphodiesterase
MLSLALLRKKWTLCGWAIWRIALNVCSIAFVLACSKVNVYDERDSDLIKDVLNEYKKAGITIESVTNNGDEFTFVFSNGHTIGFHGKTVGVVTIGIQGFWKLNGDLTGSPLMNPGETIIPTEYLNDDLYGIVEGYTDWTFYFGGFTPIKLGKTLFATDPDTVIRGINHRGYCMVAPENTLPAFRLSKLQGFNFVEADIHFTADGVPVLIHDASVDRTSDGNGLVKNFTWDEISRLDFGGYKSDEFVGTRIPSLVDFLDLCRDIELWPYLELKAGSFEQIKNIVHLVEQSGLKGRVTYISFYSELLCYVSKLDDSARLGLLVNTPLDDSAIHIIQSLKMETNELFIDSSDFSDNAVTICQRASIPLEVWTIDSKTKVFSLPQYVSGVTSNSLHAGRVLTEIK